MLTKPPKFSRDSGPFGPLLLLSGLLTQVAASNHAAAIEMFAPERCFGVAQRR